MQTDESCEKLNRENTYHTVLANIVAWHAVALQCCPNIVFHQNTVRLYVWIQRRLTVGPAVIACRLWAVQPPPAMTTTGTNECLYTKKWIGEIWSTLLQQTANAFGEICYKTNVIRLIFASTVTKKRRNATKYYVILHLQHKKVYNLFYIFYLNTCNLDNVVNDKENQQAQPVANVLVLSHKVELVFW